MPKISITAPHKEDCFKLPEFTGNLLHYSALGKGLGNKNSQTIAGHGVFAKHICMVILHA